MKTVIATLKSLSPYSQSKNVTEKKPKSESHEEFEERMWRSKLHTTADGRVMIPPMCFKNALSEAAKYLSLQVPGKGKATFTKHFEAGVLCTEPLVLPVTAEDVEPERVFCASDGKRGGNSPRVWRTFPTIQAWQGGVSFTVIDEVVLQSMPDGEGTVFEHVLTQAGLIIGIGRWRVRNNGMYGRFTVESIEIA